MVILKYKNLSFSEHEDKIRILFLKIYYFYLNKKDLAKIGKIKVKRNSIEIKSNKKEENVKQKFSYLLSKGFDNLKSTINGKPTLYIHKNSGIPLIGSNSFGIIDRGTNVIEIKPLTTCNIDCIFCSVDHTKRSSDIVVEPEYLVDELKKVVELKNNKVNIHIGSQGDPSLYGNLESLIKYIRKIKQVNAISIVTNGILINKTRVDKLIKSGLTHFHISLHTTNQEMADRLANAKYPVKKVMNVCRYISANKKAHLLIVPVWLPGINDEDVEDVIIFAKEIGAKIGIQNYLQYKFGKKPVNAIPMKVFMHKLKQLENKLKVDLTKLEGDLQIREDTKLKKPFKKNDIINVELKAKARLKNSVIAVSQDRVVTIINCQKIKGKLKVKIVRDKDNIFVATPVR